MKRFWQTIFYSLLCLSLLLLSSAAVYSENTEEEDGPVASGGCSHSAGSWTVEKDATCTADGEEAANCTLCGMTITQSIPQRDHSYGGWSVIREATIEQEGLEEGTCSSCGRTTTRRISKISPNDDIPQKPEKDVPSNSSNSAASGNISTGWEVKEGNRRYRLPSMKYATGWLQLEEGWYRFNDNGLLLTGWYQNEQNHLWYYLGGNGLMTTGWQEIDKQIYYFTASGRMMTGWFYEEGKGWYYFTPSGARKSGWLQHKDGSWYYLTDDGTMKTGWFSDQYGEWYYFSPSGRMKTGWLQLDNNWYCLSKLDGKMLRSAYAPDGSWLDPNGKWLPSRK